MAEIVSLFRSFSSLQPADPQRYHLLELTVPRQTGRAGQPDADA